MEKLEKVTEEKNVLIFLLPIGHNRALDLTDTSAEKDSDCGIRAWVILIQGQTKESCIQLCLYKNGKPIYILLPEDM